MNDKKDNRGGAGRGQGRKKDPDELVKKTIRVKKVDIKMKSAEIRQAIDEFKAKHSAG
jgi:hypothetical protein